MSEVTYTLDRDSGIATLVIDTAGSVNTIGGRFLTDMESAMTRADRDQVKGVILASAKKRSFLDGANLQEVVIEGTPQTARVFLSRFHDVCAGLAQSPFPVVAVLAGQTALGGGFELLLWACDHVFASSGSKMGLPEVNVGLFPAGGGTQTLKRVVGFKAAVQMITTARVGPAEAFVPSGMVTVCELADLESRAVAWLRAHQGIVNRNYDPGFREPGGLSDEEAQEVIGKARSRFTLSPCRPYFQAAIDSLEAGLKLPFQEATDNEIDLVVPLVESPYTRNKVDFFYLFTKQGPRLAQVDLKRAVKTDRLAVIGAGLMGQGIAQVAADRGMKVLLVDVDEPACRRGVDRIDKALSQLVEKGRWPARRKDAVMSNIDWTADYGRLERIPLVIESVFEDVPLKRKVLAQVQEVNPDTIFASNTSTIPMAEISQGSARPEQVVGMHYFTPVPLMPLLEVVQGAETGAAAVASAVTCGRAMGKTVILVGDGPGFYTSRTFGSYVMNGFRLAERGISPWDVDLMAMEAGFLQGPLRVYGMTGGSVVYHATKLVERHFPERLRVPESLARVYAAGYVGAGKPSFYLDPKKMIPDESVLEHIVRIGGIPTPTKDEAQDILLLGMANEAFWCLSDGVVRDYADMDIGAVLGVGFPDCWHGPARLVSLRGVKESKARLEDLADRFHLPGLAPAPEFERLIARGLDSSLI